MARYFVDTWYFIAFLNPRDAHHESALRLSGRLQRAEFFTHDGVITELLAFFSTHGSYWRREVAALTRDILFSGKYRVTPVRRHLLEEALSLYETRLDKAYSLTDCVSMRVMLRRELTHVLTNDHHFRQEGFTLVNE
ncbi:MAG TPA: PIN domain-containing protein [Thermoanaerobaculia bacterium]|nr:PIN domain-containing protein [Thermoanaerobaculia bacterium]